MGWEFDAHASREVKAGKKLERKPRSTGVKHLRLTISGYRHEDPDKPESLGARLNLRCCDPTSGGGGGAGQPLTAGEIAAGAYAMCQQPPKSVIKLFGGNEGLAKEITNALSYYKHTGDYQSYLTASRLTLHLLISQAVEHGWCQQPRKRGLLTRCAEVAIDDICRPQLYVDKSARSWAALLGLDNHQEWLRVWSNRYSNLRALLQEMDCAADEQFKRGI